MQSLPPQKSSFQQHGGGGPARSKLPGLRRTRDGGKKKGFAQKEQLAQVTEKEEYEYSPMKSGTVVGVEKAEKGQDE